MFLIVLLVYSVILNEKNVDAIDSYKRKGKVVSSARYSVLNARYYHKEHVNCLHQICTHAPNYPEQGIRKLMHNKDALKELFGSVFNSTNEIRLTNRYGIPDKSSQMCSTLGPTTYKPLVLRNSDSVWKWIVNVDDNIQLFTGEICWDIAPGAGEIKKLSQCYARGYFCKQDYHEVFLLTYEGGRLEFDKFPIPMTCSCVCNNNH